MHTHTHTHTQALGTSRELGKGQRPTKKAMGLRLPPRGASVWVLVFLVPPEAAEPLHEELWPQERGQVSMPGLAGAVSASGGQGPGEALHQPAGVGPESSEMPRALKPQPGRPANAGGATLGASSRGTGQAVPPQGFLPEGHSAVFTSAPPAPQPERPLPLSRQEAPGSTRRASPWVCLCR